MLPLAQLVSQGLLPASSVCWGGWWMDWWSWMEFHGDVSPCGGLQSGGDGEKGIGVLWWGIGMV